MKRVKTWKKLLSVMLSSAIVVTTLAPAAVVSAEELPSVQQSAEILNSDGTNADDASADQAESSSGNTSAAQNEQNPDNTAAPDESSDAQDTYEAADNAAAREQQPESAPSEEQTQTKAAADTKLYQNSSICIYNEQQLKAIGNGAQVYEGDTSADTFGTGAALTKEDGSALTYAADATYTLMNDIPLTRGSTWVLPDGFAGSFNDGAVTEDAPLYDADTDTIYVYNQYQLATINDPEAIKTVMSKDMIAKDFGMGQVVYADADQNTQLEYTDSHNYVVSKDFTEEMPELTAVEVQSEVTTQLGGRDYIGQVYKEIDGEKYILIGNEQQLRAIGEDIRVTPMLFTEKTVLDGGFQSHKEYEPYYPGDADLNLTSLIEVSKGEAELGQPIYQDDFSFKKADGTLANVNFSFSGVRGYRSLDSTGKIDPDKDYSDLSKEYGSLKYTSSANYIIFRNIDFSKGDFSDGNAENLWTPIMFSGNMIGALADDQHTLEALVTQPTSEKVDPKNIPVLTGITIRTTGNMNQKTTKGVGFFASLSTAQSGDAKLKDMAVSGKKIIVKNLALDTVAVDNAYGKIANPPTGIIDGLLELLGAIVGVLPGLGDALQSLLNTDEYDPTVAATGAFAGRIYGDVEVANCSVANLQNIGSDYNVLGGFAGSMQGMTEYQDLFGTLDKTVIFFVERLLDTIPLLDLGTLIKLLIDGGLLDLGKLVPTGYKAPTVFNCSVSYAGSAVVSNRANSDMYGGFVGYQSGARINQCSVNAQDTLKISAGKNAGGFAGMVTDAQVVGALQNLGVSADWGYLVNNSFILGSEINGNVEVTADNNAGGFAGGLGNSYLVESGINGYAQVKANKNNAGGITGFSSVSEGFSLGDTDKESNKELLETLGGLVSQILSGNADADLLSLAGIYPSYIAGCYVNQGASVTASGDYAGGISGRADGTQIINSSQLTASEDNGTGNTQAEGSTADENGDFTQIAGTSRVWNKVKDRLNYTVKGLDNQVVGKLTVEADNYAGGAAGQLTAVNMSGVLNNTLAPYMKPFALQGVSIEATGESYIKADNSFAGGAMGLGLGGNADDVTVSGLSYVQAGNCAGGFAGAVGTADLLSTGGLNLLGLDLVSVEGLLKLGSALQVKISNSEVSGPEDGFYVEAVGIKEGEIDAYYAGGFIGNAIAAVVSDSYVSNLDHVKADKNSGFAGGFIGKSQTAGLADALKQDDEGTDLVSLIKISDLVNLVPYLSSKFTSTKVSFAGDSYVEADVAGGFAGELQSAEVDGSGLQPETEKNGQDIADTGKRYAVSGLHKIQGSTYGGGFCGRLVSGAFISAGKGLEILGGKLSINAADLVNLIQAYKSTVKSAGVKGNKLIVIAETVDKNDSNSGSAGGYLGYGCAMTITNSDVVGLAHTKVTGPKDLESKDGSSYFSDSSSYAVTGGHYAGGFAGRMDIGSTAAVADKLSIIDKVANVDDLASALQVVASKVSQCDIYGEDGGFSVLASLSKSKDGVAGGYVGRLDGSQISESDVTNFEYIIGERAAGGYVGMMIPGDVLSLLDDTSLLDKVVNLSGTIASLMSFYISKIEDSSTSAIPCGGVVRANEPSDDKMYKGMAGGYVGYSEGGQILGTDEECAANRIRSIYGYEYAGGYTGFMKAADTLSAGNVSLLGGLITADNLLGVLQIVYPIQKNTAVYGPLQNLNLETWNAWAKAVGQFSAYGGEEIKAEGFKTAEQMNQFLEAYSYGYNIVAGRESYDTGAYRSTGGMAGGYVGCMKSGLVEKGYTFQVAKVRAMSAAGGFAGEMIPGAAADIGSIGVFDGLISIDLNQLARIVQVLVPIVRASDTVGCSTGMTVQATGKDKEHYCGDAGGFAGRVTGGQINTGDLTSGNTEQKEGKTECSVINLKGVEGTNHVGGFAGSMETGAAAVLNTDASMDENNALKALLDTLLGTDGNLAQALKTVITNVEYASVRGLDGTGFTVNGQYEKDNYADYAGGFAGLLDGAVVGRDDQPDGIQVDNLAGVIGGDYAGGMFGLADISSAATVMKEGSSILHLIQTKNIGLLENFRTYIYNASVSGIDKGFTVEAKSEEKTGTNEATSYKGNAGGFGGSLVNGTVSYSTVDNLSKVTGKSYVGGFIGYMAKSGTLDADQISAAGSGILDLSAGLLDIWGAHAYSSSVTGISAGFTVKSTGGTLGNDSYVQSIAGGFVGFADNASIMNAKDQNQQGCTVTNLKQVSSDQIAGGFAGRTNMAFLANIEADSKLVDSVLVIVQKLLDALNIADIQQINLAELNIPGIAKVEVLKDGNVASITLLGLKISVSLGQDAETDNRTVYVTIGDSEIVLHCDKDGKLTDDAQTISLHLIKANRTRILNSQVEGIDIGYDVFGGGADNSKDGNETMGYAGGFVGYNKEGLLENNNMLKADTIRGTKDKIGEFVGKSDYKSSYAFNDLKDIEGNNNKYHIYRLWDADKLWVVCNSKDQLLATSSKEAVEVGGISYYVYEAAHRSAEYLADHEDWKDAYQTPNSGSAAKFPVNVYVSDAQADLMLGTPTEENVSDPDKIGEGAQDPCATEATLTIQKLWIDNNNQLNERPKEIDVCITRDGAGFQNIKMSPNTADTDKNSWVWSEPVSIGILNDAETGYEKVYKYDVIEKEIPGYTTIYNWSDDGYTLYIFNYLTSELVQGDSVVIDYGLPVDIDVLANDRVDENNAKGKVVGISSDAASTEGTSSNAFTSEASGVYGNAILKDNGVIRYTPNTMQMDSIDKFTYQVQLNQEVVKNNQTYVKGSLDVIPATEIYYEDNFNEGSVIRYYDQPGVAEAEDGAVTYNAWRTVGTADQDVQDTDRPGIDAEKIIEDVYGNDSSYADDVTYSGGSSHAIRVNKDVSQASDGPRATFTFTGTGFDFISKTAGDTGAIRVYIYKGDKGVYQNEDGKWNANKENRLKIITVQTYYGYEYKDGQWEIVENPGDSALYQIPVVKYEAPEYGTYTVEIRPFYSAVHDEQSKGYYDLYVDGLRIYNPARTSAEDNGNYNEIQDIYKQDGEINPQFMELRDLLLNASGVMDTDKNGYGEEEKTASDPLKNGIVYIDGKASDVSLSEYKAYGPDNEVYLENDQAVAFYLVADKVPDSIELAAKLAQGKSADLSFACAVENDNSSPLDWDPYKTKTVTIASAYDMHYSISNQCWWEQTEDGKFKTKYPIIVYRKSADGAADDSNSKSADGAADDSNIISLTNLNWTGAVENSDGTDAPIKISAYADANAARAAYSLVAVQKERTVTVLYQDQDGNQLADAAVQTVTDGVTYDMTELVNHQIDGYVQKEILGDPVQGTADADKVITVVYEKEAPKLYTLKVSYADREGNVLSEAYVQENVTEGTAYDLTEQIGKEIKGYEIVEITGDAVKGMVSGDVNVAVIYEKEPSVIDNIVDAVNKVVDGINKVVDWVSDAISSIFPWW